MTMPHDEFEPLEEVTSDEGENDETLHFTDEDYANPMDLGDEPVNLEEIDAETLSRFVGPPLEGEEETLRAAEERRQGTDA